MIIKILNTKRFQIGVKVGRNDNKTTLLKNSKKCKRHSPALFYILQNQAWVGKARAIFSSNISAKRCLDS